MIKVSILRRKAIGIFNNLVETWGDGEVQSIDTGIDIGLPPSKISWISSTPPLVGCKNMQPLDPSCTWSCLTWGYLSIIAGSPFWSGGGGCTDWISSNWWQACYLHSFFFTSNRLLTNCLFCRNLFHMNIFYSNLFQEISILFRNCRFFF